jgi:hypothetical protein
MKKFERLSTMAAAALVMVTVCLLWAGCSPQEVVEPEKPVRRRVPVLDPAPLTGNMFLGDVD